MLSRKIQSKKRYFLAFLIGTIVFVLIFGISYSLSYIEFQRVSNLQEDVAYKIFEDKIQYSLFGEDICSEMSFGKITEDLRFQGRIIDDLEKKFEKENKMVLDRKKFYTLIELEHYEFVKTMNNKCNLGRNIALFFYSNKKSDLDKSEDMGRLLDIVYDRNKNLSIYSFDVNLESDLIDKLKTEFEVETPLMVVINEKCKFEDLTALKELESCLD